MKTRLLLAVAALALFAVGCENADGSPHTAKRHVNGANCFVDHNHSNVQVGGGATKGLADFTVDLDCTNVRVVFTYGSPDLSTVEVVELVRNSGVWTQVQGAVGVSWSTSLVAFPGTGSAERLGITSPPGFLAGNTQVRTNVAGVTKPSATTFDSYH